jgi:hypothetical protein
MMKMLDHTCNDAAGRSSSKHFARPADGKYHTVVLTEGTSWPGGLAQKRFGWLESPSSQEEVVENLLHALDADLGEHEAVLAWGDDAGGVAGCKPGIIAYILRTQDYAMSLDDLDRLACEVASNREQATVIHVEMNGVAGAAQQILEMARVREPTFDMA